MLGSSVEKDTHRAASSESVGGWPHPDTGIFNELLRRYFSQCGPQAACIQFPGHLFKDAGSLVPPQTHLNRQGADGFLFNR